MTKVATGGYRGSYMSAHVLLNKLRKREKMQGLLSILSLFCNKFNESNNIGLYLSYDIKITWKPYFGIKK